MRQSLLPISDLAGLFNQDRKWEFHRLGGSLHGDELIGVAHSCERKGVGSFEAGDDAIGRERLRFAGIGKFNERQQHAELRTAGIDGHERGHRDQRPNSHVDGADSVAEKSPGRAGAFGKGRKRLSQEIRCRIGEGETGGLRWSSQASQGFLAAFNRSDFWAFVSFTTVATGALMLEILILCVRVKKKDPLDKWVRVAPAQ